MIFIEFLHDFEEPLDYLRFSSVFIVSYVLPHVIHYSICIRKWQISVHDKNNINFLTVNLLDTGENQSEFLFGQVLEGAEWEDFIETTKE